MFRVEQLKPLDHVFFHIHYGYGGVYDKNTLYFNTATCNERYQPIHAKENEMKGYEKFINDKNKEL